MFATYKGLQDLFPTLVALAGAKMPDQELDGVNLTPLFQDQPLVRDSLYWHLPNYTGNLSSNGRVWQPPASAIRCGKWKFDSTPGSGHVRTLRS